MNSSPVTVGIVQVMFLNPGLSTIWGLETRAGGFKQMGAETL